MPRNTGQLPSGRSSASMAAAAMSGFNAAYAASAGQNPSNINKDNIVCMNVCQHGMITENHSSHDLLSFYGCLLLCAQSIVQCQRWSNRVLVFSLPADYSRAQASSVSPSRSYGSNASTPHSTSSYNGTPANGSYTGSPSNLTTSPQGLFNGIPSCPILTVLQC